MSTDPSKKYAGVLYFVAGLIWFLAAYTGNRGLAFCGIGLMFCLLGISQFIDKRRRERSAAADRAQP